MKKPGKDSHNNETILEEAHRLVNGDRQDDYGHPLDDYKKTVEAFNALTGHDLSPEDGVLFMVCVKLSREQNKHKRDNLVDGAGYIQCLDMVHQESERRENPKNEKVPNITTGGINQDEFESSLSLNQSDNFAGRQ